MASREKGGWPSDTPIIHHRKETVMPQPSWPFNLTDPVRAIHLADDPECPYDDLSRCPYEATVRKIIRAYQTWTAAHPEAVES